MNGKEVLGVLTLVYENLAWARPLRNVLSSEQPSSRTGVGLHTLAYLSLVLATIALSLLADMTLHAQGAQAVGGICDQNSPPAGCPRPTSGSFPTSQAGSISGAAGGTRKCVDNPASIRFSSCSDMTLPSCHALNTKEEQKVWAAAEESERNRVCKVTGTSESARSEAVPLSRQLATADAGQAANVAALQAGLARGAAAGQSRVANEQATQVQRAISGSKPALGFSSAGATDSATPATIVDPFATSMTASGGQLRALQARLDALLQLRRESSDLFDQIDRQLDRDYATLRNTAAAIDMIGLALGVLQNLGSIAMKSYQSLELTGTALEKANQELAKEGLKMPAEILGDVAADSFVDAARSHNGLVWAVGSTVVQTWLDWTTPSFWAAAGGALLDGRSWAVAVSRRPADWLAEAKSRTASQRRLALTSLNSKIAEAQSAVERKATTKK